MPAGGRLARVVVLTTAMLIAAIGVVRGTWAVGGSDSSCYALMAEALARGAVQPRFPLALEAPWRNASRSFAPGGFIPSPVKPGAASPICAPGFSLLMTPLVAFGGRDAIFLVSPAMGALLIWLTYLLGRRIGGELVGALAAVMMAATPVLLFQLVQPMNDTTVTTLWVAVMVVILGSSRAEPDVRRDLLAGGLSGLALLVRPNLLPALGPVVAWLLWRRPVRWKSLIAFAAGVAPFAIVLLVLNTALYGHALSSGYGDARNLFSLTHLGPNLINYGTTLLVTQLGAPLLGVVAGMVAPSGQRSAVWLLLAFCGSVAAVYLLYSPFPEWWYLRFLLPTMPVLSVLAVATMTWLWRPMVAIVIVVLVVLFMMRSAAVQEAWSLRRLEARFHTTGEVVRTRIPATAIFFTVFDSGSVVHHAGREPILWDALAPEDLDRALAWTSERGREPFLVLEDWEEPIFRQRFAGRSTVAALDWPPRFVIDRRVKIYSPADRARYLAGASIPTETVWSDRR